MVHVCNSSAQEAKRIVGTGYTWATKLSRYNDNNAHKKQRFLEIVQHQLNLESKRAIKRWGRHKAMGDDRDAPFDEIQREDNSGPESVKGHEDN